jgi:hypothetical protein
MLAAALIWRSLSISKSPLIAAQLKALNPLKSCKSISRGSASMPETDASIINLASSK